jgi:hypothetical protein
MPTTYQNKLSATATNQYAAYRDYHETDAPLRAQIKKYWTEIGLVFHGTAEPWSAVFVSWCVAKAGASAAEFRFAPQHSQFVHWAIGHANDPGALFKGRDVALYLPKVGDIIQNNRSGNAFTFEHASTHNDYASHSAVVIETGTDAQGKYLMTIGGNENDTVGRRIVRLTSAGKIRQPVPSHFISIIETLK